MDTGSSGRLSACVAFAVGVVAATSTPARLCAQQTERVAIFYCDQVSHREAAAALESTLRQAGYPCTMIELPRTSDEASHDVTVRKLIGAKPDIVAAAGTRATLIALQTLADVPVVFFMVPNALDAPFLAPDSPYANRVGGLTTDVAPDDQLDWILRLVPATRTIVVPVSERSAKTAAAIETVARRRGVTIRTIPAQKEQFADSVQVLNGKPCDGVLMVPDADIYDSLTVQRLLLWGIREKKPVWAFSDNVVRAGALGSIHSDDQTMGLQAAGFVQQVLQGTDIGRIGLQYPAKNHHVVNDRTAELIGVSLAPDRVMGDTVHLGNDR